MPITWFQERIKVTILHEKDDTWEEVKVLSKEHAGWLHESQKYGHAYTDMPAQENVCVACEG